MVVSNFENTILNRVFLQIAKIETYVLIYYDLWSRKYIRVGRKGQFFEYRHISGGSENFLFIC